MVKIIESHNENIKVNSIVKNKKTGDIGIVVYIEDDNYSKPYAVQYNDDWVEYGDDGYIIDEDPVFQSKDEITLVRNTNTPEVREFLNWWMKYHITTDAKQAFNDYLRRY